MIVPVVPIICKFSSDINNESDGGMLNLLPYDYRCHPYHWNFFHLGHLKFNSCLDARLQKDRTLMMLA